MDNSGFGKCKVLQRTYYEVKHYFVKSFYLLSSMQPCTNEAIKFNLHQLITIVVA